MELYLPIKHIHMLTAYLTALLFMLRLSLDGLGYSGWRKTPLKWLPHVNDTVLLLMAVSMVSLARFDIPQHPWLWLKILLLVGYIIAGLFALKPKYNAYVRVGASVLALAQLAGIFFLAIQKPYF